ncbi:MAG: signal peptidase I, partial [Candidatus Hydrogenedentes bacterium]|nr:signal peptidase I [Candidatus Hydrogenedentota bacterium]
IVLILIALRLFFYRLCAIPVSEQNKDVDHLLVSFIRYGLHIPLLRGSPIRWRKPARGDLVFYSAKVADTKEWLFLVGRIAATPGEQVGFENGALLINDTPMTLPAPAPKTYESIATEAPYGRNKSKAYSVVPENSYFILSDAQGSSDMTLDSRICGWVPESDIQGKISLCWWPLKRRGKR